jgi:hypothetical protein
MANNEPFSIRDTGTVIWAPRSQAVLSLDRCNQDGCSWVGCAHSLWPSLCISIQLSGNWPLVVSLAACIHSHSFTPWPLNGCLQRFWPYCILLDHWGYPLKSPWKPLWPHISCILQTLKPASGGGCQSWPPTCAVQPGPTHVRQTLST